MHSPPRVLILDSSADLIACLSDLLVDDGYAVEGHFVSELRKDGSAGRTLLRAFEPDAVLFDVAPPLRDTWHSLLEFEKLPEARAVPLIIMSTSWEQLPKLTANHTPPGFVLKPFNVNELLHLVAVATGRDCDEVLWQGWFSEKRHPAPS